MKSVNAMFKRIIVWSIVALSLNGTAMASGFALLEQNASGMGNSYAGRAAVAEDASTIYFNPAGLLLLYNKQIVMAAHAIRPSLKFSGTGKPGNDMGNDAGSLAIIPNGYFAMEVDPELRLGLGIGAPFGLQTEYTSSWVGRAHAIKSKLEAINLNPTLALRVNKSLSLGAGVNYQHIRGELTSNPLASSIGAMTGSDSSWGYNLGVLVEISPQTRTGLAYRSGIDYNLLGNISFTAPLAFLSGPASLAIKMPASFSASVFHKIDSKWDAMADVTWTGWNVLKELRVLRPNGATIQVIQENWRDTWRVALGGNYHYNEQLTSRIGVAYEQSPVRDAFRTANIPDNNRYEISFGGQYKLADCAIDMAYAHLFINNASINSKVAAPTLVGNYRSSADILSVQYTYSF